MNELPPNRPPPINIDLLIPLTRDRVLAEVLNWTRQRLAMILQVNPDNVMVEWFVEDGKLKPRIEINTAAAEGVTDDEINKVIQGVVQNEVHPQLVERMRGLTQRRRLDA